MRDISRQAGAAMRDILAITKALSDSHRLRAVMFLRGGELCVCQIIAMLGLAPSTVSKHMAILHRAGLVETRKEGRWIYYRLARERADANVRRTLEWLAHSLAGDRLVRRDERHLASLRKQAPDKLCVCYRAPARVSRSGSAGRRSPLGARRVAKEGRTDVRNA